MSLPSHQQGIHFPENVCLMGLKEEMAGVKLRRARVIGIAIRR
jgi:hypothetical protein